MSNPKNTHICSRVVLSLHGEAAALTRVCQVKIKLQCLSMLSGLTHTSVFLMLTVESISFMM